MSKFLFSLVFIATIASCTKTSTTIVPGNVPPPDHTIDSSTITIYLNKTYINLIGRKALGTEQSAALVTLRSHNFSVADRQAFIQTLFLQPEYNRTLFVNANKLYLNSTDSMQVAQQIYQFNYDLTQSSYSAFYSYLTFEINTLDTLQNTLSYMNAGLMDYRAMLKRMVNCYIYDEVNMGTQNFVVSTFQNFLFRYPNTSELIRSENMVNDTTSQIFLQVGQNKQDYINIFFASDDFIQGQVQLIFQQYLFRKPTSAEFAFYSNIYKTTNDYKQLQLAVLSLDEYAGLH